MIKAVLMPKKKTPQQFYTVTEAAREKKVTRAAIHAAIKAGRLPATYQEIERTVKTRVLSIPASSLKALKVDLAQQKRGKKN